MSVGIRLRRLIHAVLGVGLLASLLAGSVLTTAAAPSGTVACTTDALIAAIEAANQELEATIRLTPNCRYVLEEPYIEDDPLARGPNGLPRIRTNLTIEGNGATIARSDAPGTQDFRILLVDDGYTLVLDNVTLENGARPDGWNWVNRGGAILVSSGAQLEVTNSRIIGNRAYYGGGIFGDPDSSVSLYRTLVQGNHAGETGGGVYTRGPLTIEESHITENSADFDAGGIMAQLETPDMVRIVGTTIDHNSGVIGTGGLVAIHYSGDGTTLVERSTIAANTGDFIGGMDQHWGTLLITNSTITGNEATGTYLDATSGLYINEAEATLTNVTVARNTGAVGVFVRDSTVRVANSLVVENDPVDCTFQVIDEGHNLESGTSCGFTEAGSAQDVADAGLEDLADNGGPTPTMALRPDSPALGAGNPAVCHDPETVAGLDQRGYRRPLESCSIGAFELNAHPPADPVPAGPYVVTQAGRLLPHGGSRSIYWLPLAIRDLDGQPVHSLFIATQLRPADAPDHAGQLGKRILLPIGKGQYLLLLTRRDQLQEPGDYVLTLYDLRTRTSHEILVTFSGD